MDFAALRPLPLRRAIADTLTEAGQRAGGGVDANDRTNADVRIVAAQMRQDGHVDPHQRVEDAAVARIELARDAAFAANRGVERRQGAIAALEARTATRRTAAQLLRWRFDNDTPPAIPPELQSKVMGYLD